MSIEATIRASSIAHLSSCALSWASKYLDDGKIPSTPPAAIGSAVHASSGVYDQSRIDGDPVSIDDAAAVVVDYLHDPNDDVAWAGFSRGDAEKIGILAHVRYCNELAPSRTFTHVEHKLAEATIEVDGVSLTLTGTLDRVRRENETLICGDIKTGGRAVTAEGQAVTGKHGAQLGAYSLLGSLEFGETMGPPEILAIQTSGKTRVAVGTIPNAIEQLIGHDDAPGYLHYVANMFRTGLFPPNAGSLLCSRAYCTYWDKCRFK